MTEKQQILLAANNLAEMLKAHDAEVEEKVRLLSLVLARLPRVSLVDDDSIEQDVLIQGVMDMFPFAHRHRMSPDEIRRKRAAFLFFPGGTAEIREGWYDGQSIIKDSWMTVTQTILDMLVLCESSLNERQKEAIEALSNAFKK